MESWWSFFYFMMDAHGQLCNKLVRPAEKFQGSGIPRSPSARSLSRSPSPPPPSFTQSPSSPRSLVRDGQTSPHRPRLVVSRSTCPPLYPSPHANSFIIGTAVINTRVTYSQSPPQQPSTPLRCHDHQGAHYGREGPPLGGGVGPRGGAAPRWRRCVRCHSIKNSKLVVVQCPFTRPPNAPIPAGETRCLQNLSIRTVLSPTSVEYCS
jgi:hypothetical protein